MPDLNTVPKALLFDVFGTVVDWRSSVTRFLSSKTNPNSPLTDNQWEQFAAEWYEWYLTAAHDYIPGKSQWQKADELYRTALDELVLKWGIDQLWTKTQKDEIAMIWHHLEPRPDSVEGIAQLNSISKTCTLSDGNKSLLADLLTHGNLPFNQVLSAEDFGAYKPHPSVYQGAARRLGFEPGDCALVAAHLGDCEGAKRAGLKAIYIERAKEERWDDSKVQNAKAEGWVDCWIEGEGGFMELSDRLKRC
ncbi:MAG: hypothetical protein M1831_003960 [Alyxoria varia]|nr:MAG: hypothetical protein M1831_003960 [Alyxoria varia]